MKPRSRRRGGEDSKQRIVVGLHAVSEALKVRPHAISAVWVRDGGGDARGGAVSKLILQAEQVGVSIVKKPVGVLDRLSHSHQGVAALVNESPQWSMDQLANDPTTMLLALDGIEDPQNLGAVLRTAWLMGVKALFIPQDRAAPLTSSAMKVASGGAEHVAVIAVPSLPQTLKDLKEQDVWVYGLAEEGRNTLYQLQLPERFIWVVGAEDSGLRSTVKNVCDDLVRIPQVTGGSSYNAAVSAAIAMAEGARQRK